MFHFEIYFKYTYHQEIFVLRNWSFCDGIKDSLEEKLEIFEKNEFRNDLDGCLEEIQAQIVMEYSVRFF